MTKIEILQLSVRSMNCLKADCIYYIEDLMVLSEQYLSRLPNMGVKSLNEIKNALDQIGLSLGMNPADVETDDSHYISGSIAQVPDIEIWLNAIADIKFKKERLAINIKSKIENLSVRSCNALNIEMQNHSDVIEFFKYLFAPHTLLNLRNVGKTSEVEIQAFLIKIRKEIEDLYYSKKITLETSFDLMTYMGISKNFIEEYREKYQDRGVNIFRVIDFLLTKKFTQKELEILKSRNNNWNENPLTLQELGEQLGVTRERVRQIETKVNKKLWVIIEGLFPYCSLIDIRQQYEFDRNFIDDVSIINEQDNTNFSDNFLYRTLSILLKNDYRVIVDDENKYRYLINKTISEVFDFRGFVDKIYALLLSNDIDYKLILKGIQHEYYKSAKRDDNVISEICENLLYSEFNIIPDVDNNITIKSKKQKSIEYYVEEALISNNRPTHLDDIYETIKNKYPKFNKSLRYAGNAMVGNDKFIFFDRNSTYGLNIWEGKLTQNSVLIDIVRPNKTKKSRSGIKVWNENGKVIVRGGTMINIVVDYLKEFQEPQHIDDIFIEVYKWRETNKFKLMSNLNNSDYFTFENRYVGLLNE